MFYPCITNYFFPFSLTRPSGDLIFCYLDLVDSVNLVDVKLYQEWENFAGHSHTYNMIALAGEQGRS